MKFAARDGTSARTLAFTAPSANLRPAVEPISGGSDQYPIRSRHSPAADGPPGLSPSVGRAGPARPTVVTYQRGQEIFTPGHGEHLVYVVRTGCVRLYKILPDGRSINLGLLGPSTVFTQEDGVDGIGSGAIAEALVETSVSIVEMDDLAALVAESPDLAGAIVNGMTRRLTELQTLVEHLLVRDAAVRLATTLLSLAQRFGRSNADGHVTIALPLTHQALANMIGSNRVTVTRKLLELQEGGHVRSLGRNAIAIDPQSLRQFAHTAGDVG